MKTNFRKWLYGLTMILSVAFIFPACSDDDKGGGEEDVQGALVGTWTVADGGFSYVFKKDGSFTMVISSGVKYRGIYDYNEKKGKLWISYYDGEDQEEEYDVEFRKGRLELTDKDGTLLFFKDEEEDDNGGDAVSLVGTWIYREEGKDISEDKVTFKADGTFTELYRQYYNGAWDIMEDSRGTYYYDEATKEISVDYGKGHGYYRWGTVVSLQKDKLVVMQSGNTYTYYRQ